MRSSKRRYALIGAGVGLGTGLVPLVLAIVLDALGPHTGQLSLSLWMISAIPALPLCHALVWLASIGVLRGNPEATALYVMAAAPFISPTIVAIVGAMCGLVLHRLQR